MSTRVLTVLYMIYKLFNINSNKFISHLGYSTDPRHVLKKEKKNTIFTWAPDIHEKRGAQKTHFRRYVTFRGQFKCPAGYF